MAMHVLFSAEYILIQIKRRFGINQFYVNIFIRFDTFFILPVQISTKNLKRKLRSFFDVILLIFNKKGKILSYEI